MNATAAGPARLTADGLVDDPDDRCDGLPPLPADGSVCNRDFPAAHTIRAVIARLGDKWSLLVVGLLGDGPARFTELQRRIDGISHRMLTQTLRSLERDGLVERTVFAEIPPRVEYELTPLGESLLVPALGLVRWAAAHHPELAEARERYDEAHSED